MTMTMTIDQFNTLLHGQQDGSDVMQMLKQLVTKGKPQDIQRMLLDYGTLGWGWGPSY